MNAAAPGRIRWPRRVLTFLAVLNGFAALGGAWGLASGSMDLGATVTGRLPWGSPTVAGIALGALVALPNAVLVAVAWRRGRHTGLVGVAVGVAMEMWIVVELAFIREVSFFHPLYVAVGAAMVFAGLRAVRLDLGVRPSSLARELRDALADVPRFLGAPLMRRRHLRWGAVDDEVDAALPGDDRVPDPDYVSTRAITIAVPPERVWPWLVQVGRGRAGFYSDDLLDNGAVPSAEDIDERWQQLEIGQWVPMSERISPRTAFRVAATNPPYDLLWHKPDSTWAWRLTPTATGGTRLVTRIRAVHDGRTAGAWLSSLVLLELGDYAMQRRMLLHLRERAERSPAHAWPRSTS